MYDKQLFMQLNHVNIASMVFFYTGMWWRQCVNEITSHLFWGTRGVDEVGEAWEQVRELRNQNQKEAEVTAVS